MTAEDEVFAALANPTRRTLLRLLLEEGPQPMQSLAVRFAMRRPSISEHLRVLRDAGLVSGSKIGREWHYQLEPEQLQPVRDWLSPYERFWRQRLTAMRNLLDDQDEQAPADGRTGPGRHRAGEAG